MDVKNASIKVTHPVLSGALVDVTDQHDVSEVRRYVVLPGIGPMVDHSCRAGYIYIWVSYF